MRRFVLPLSLLGLLAVVWVWAAIDPVSRSDWLLENLLVFLTLPVLALTYRAIPLRPASYVSLFLFLCLHVVGSHWSYSNVPWTEGWGGRNHYDRIVHFGFGLLCTLPLVDSILALRVAMPKWVWPVAVQASFALSALYEVIEWVTVAIVSPELGAEFLGSQGDAFDAVKDMALGLGGALAVWGVAAAGKGMGFGRRELAPVMPCGE